MSEMTDLMTGIVLEEEHIFTLSELCQSCCLSAEQVIRIVDQGIIEPIETKRTINQWEFSGSSLQRIRTTIRLQHDLGVNLAGAALAIDLMDEINTLRRLHLT